MDLTNHEKTPKKILLSGLTTKKTPISTPKNFTTRFLLLSNNNSILTPPSSTKNRVVRNPFENYLHEKLRLPVISSPSLFQPSKKQNEENKLEIFEWTIEELSNLNPVNVVPHETQFLDDEIDPKFEEKAQEAISSFFQEQQIVPSPHGCNIRKQKIQLFDENFHSTKIYNSTTLPSINSAMISSSTSLKCDISTQTALTFPPNLPREIEDLLRKYTTHDVSCEDEKKNSTKEDDLQAECSNNDRSMMDISTLRRKLFIPHPERPETPDNEFLSDDAIYAVNLSPAPKTPDLTRSSFIRSSQDNNEEVFGVINDDLFGQLSPIRNDDDSNNFSPVMSSNDISMTSDGRDYTPASSRFKNGKLKKKRLSESFSLLQNDFNNDNDSSDDNRENVHNEFPVNKKNQQHNNINKNGRILRRFDSGFENSDSNHTMNYSFSSEFMQI